MKKVYSRPTIEIEEFTLSAHIAGNCMAGANGGNSLGRPGHDKGDCGWIDRDGDTIFTTGMRVCEYQYEDGAYNMYCYHTPTEQYRLFSS